MKKNLLFTLTISIAIILSAQDYSNMAQITKRAQALKDKYPDKVQLKSLGKTTVGYDIWVLTLGKGETSRHPAIAITGGVDGRHLLGVEMAMGIAENLLTQPDIDAILAQNTYYIFPNVNPDATEQYFAPLRYERTLNGRKTDNDRDGTVGEDPFEDLNNDKMITKMRIESPKGTHIESSVDPRILIKADLSKGEVGKYLLLSEGIDNDKDGLFNEDGEGGVNFNKNFTFMYKNFQPEGGDWAVSEVESKAVADFLFDAFNVHTVISFSLHNNISRASKALSTRQTGYGPENSDDSQFYSYVTSLYNQSVPGITNTTALPAEGGEFHTWAYQHYGRYSFATPGWWPVSTNKATEGNLELTYLDWAAANSVTDVFLPWTVVINHPDFPDNKVEVGGIKPYLMYNPPYKMVNDLVKQHTSFVTSITKAAPRISIVSFKKETLDKNISRVTLVIKNNGVMPTINQIGERSQYLKYITTQLKLASGQKLMNGNLKTMRPVLKGGETVELVWLVQGSGKLSVETGTPTAGYATAEVTL